MKLMRWRRYYFLLSLLVIIPGVISLIVNGVKPSIEFTGGSLLEIRVIEVNEQGELSFEQFKDILEPVYPLESVQQSGSNQLILKGKAMGNDQKNLVIDVINTEVGQVEELRFEAVGPSLGRELIKKTILGAIVAATLIMIYVWVQFDELKYGISAILAMFHDSLILLGTFSILGYFYGIEVDVLFVTALLTTLSFSVHDTIVVFDRIRELRRRHRKIEFEELVDVAVTETLGRSINNSMTIIFMLSALALLGGESIRWFSIALLLGAITGTYSSTFMAAPLLLLWEDIKVKFKKS